MKKIAVIGAGTMGNGIAHVFGLHDYHVNLVDISAKQLEKGLATISTNLDRMVQKNKISTDEKVKALVNIHTSPDLAEAVSDADLVIEAITESEDSKLKVFKEMDRHAPKTCLLASNTSSISITKIAGYIQASERVIGMHFMNPVPIMSLVEVIRGYQTSDAVCKAALDLVKAIGKTPVVVNDYPGFVTNRILMPMINEAMYALSEGVAGVAAIDKILRLGMAHPMGPLQLADFIGLDVCLSILDVLYEGFGNPKYAPCPLLINMVNAGRLGKKVGVGFYTYHPDGKITVTDRVSKI